MSLLRTHSSNPNQPADQNEGQPGDAPTTAQPVTAATDDPAAGYDQNYDARPAPAATDDESVPAAGYGRGDYADEMPAGGQRTAEQGGVPTFTPATPASDTSTPASDTTTRASDTTTRASDTTVAPVPTQRTTDEGRTVSQAVPVTATELDGPLLGEVDAAELRNRWQQVQSEFVDDPKAAVGGAADLVEQTAQALVSALQQRQGQMRGLWQQDQSAGTAGSPSAADTEQLRMVMQRYRTLFNALCER